MTKYNIKLFSKKKDSLKRYLKFLKKSLLTIKNPQLNFKRVREEKKRRKITVLKSPHVNKSAQKHLQILTYKAKVSYFAEGAKKDLVIIKKMKNHLFSDIKIKIEKKSRTYKKQMRKSSIFFVQNLKLMRNSDSFSIKQRQKRFLLFAKISQKSEQLEKQKLLHKVLTFLMVFKK